jgi:adenine phosphoribosyltransferase
MDERIEILRTKIRTIPDFPKPGIFFRDVTTLWNDPEGFKLSTDLFAEAFRDAPFDTVIGIESRGFILGAALADRLGKGFVPIRKQGKLPAPVERYEYRVLIMDDLLATGGTLQASTELLRRIGGQIVACAVLVELEALGGRALLEKENQRVFSLVRF